MMRLYARDFLFNNGLVNLYRFIEEYDLDIKTKLEESYLEIDLNDEKFYKIFALFLKEYKIVYQTDNDRWYFDEKDQEFIIDKRFDIKNAGPTDVRNTYEYISKNEVDESLIFEKLEQFGKKYGFDIYKKNPALSYEPLFKETKLVKNLVKHLTLDEFIEKFINYSINSDNSGKIRISSKIHPFEDGANSFHYLLKIPKNYKINKYEALVYWMGAKIKRFYYGKFYIFVNSANLLYLYKFKKDLKIQEERASDTPTNIDFSGQFSKINILNRYFYISKSESEFELKALLYIFSYFYYIDKMAGSDTKRRYKELSKILPFISFVSFTEDGTFKTSLNEYTKAYQLFRFFEKLSTRSLFNTLANILSTFSLLKRDEFLLESFVKKFLNFNFLNKELFLASFDILRDESKGFPKELYDFYNEYLHFIRKEDVMKIHTLSKIVGEEIGRFCALVDDKDLLFKLRNVKNYKQLVAFFRDFKYDVLKNEENAYFSKEFEESLEKLIEDEEHWELIRDFIAIYAINKYRSVKYAKSVQGV